MAFEDLCSGCSRGQLFTGLRRTAQAAAAMGGAVFGALLPAHGEEGSLGIELNRLQDMNGACRISLVFTNGLADTVDALSIETVLFNKDGAVERFLVLKSNPLPSGKVRVQQFDAKGTACDDVGRLLLNDVKDCKIEGVTPQDCLAVIKPSSRTDVRFFSTATESNAGKDQGQ